MTGHQCAHERLEMRCARATRNSEKRMQMKRRSETARDATQFARRAANCVRNASRRFLIANRFFFFFFLPNRQTRREREILHDVHSAKKGSHEKIGEKFRLS